jgi:hypothetical protein
MFHRQQSKTRGDSGRRKETKKMKTQIVKNFNAALFFRESNVKRKITNLATAAMLAGSLLAFAVSGRANDGVAGNLSQSKDSATLDPTLAISQNVYWRWSFSQITLPSDKNGNAVIGDLVFMALPNAPGDGTPGSIGITMKSGEAFFLPLWNLLGNSYQDGSSDPVINLNVFRTLDFKLTLDGVTLIDGRNLMEHYSQFPFVPSIPYDVPPATAFIRLQGISVLHGPLSPGKHVLHLDAKNTDTADLFDLTIEYHNTWNLTVQPGR